MIPDQRLRELVARAVSLTDGAPEALRAPLAAVILDHSISEDREEPSVNLVRKPPTALDTDVKVPETLVETFARLRSRTQKEQVAGIVAHAYEALHVDGMTVDELAIAYSELRTPAPGNLSEVVARSVREGWLTRGSDREGKRTWRITKRGLAGYHEWLNDAV